MRTGRRGAQDGHAVLGLGIDDAIAYAGARRGTAGDDVFIGTNKADRFDLSQGGADTLTMLNNNDWVTFGAAFDSGDRVDGGAGSDMLEITGTYAALTVAGAMMQNVETLYFRPTGTSRITLAADLRSDWASFYVFADAPMPGAVTTIDASALSQSGYFIAMAGHDTILGSAFDDDFDWRIGGDDTFVGGAGADFVNFKTRDGGEPDGVVIDLRVASAQQVGTGSVALSGIEGVGGTDGDDRLTGTAAANVFFLHGGDDVVSAGAGNDWIAFQEVDAIDAGRRVVVDGGIGADFFSLVGVAGLTVSLAKVAAQATPSGWLTIRGVESLSGGVGGDTLSGNGGANILLGFGGDDRLSGGAGDDVLAGSGAVLLPGNYGDTAWSIDPTVSQSYQDDDVLDGGAGDDTLYGNLGDDVLKGGLGADRLTGGTGDDRFVYAAAAESRGAATDTIVDFQKGDRIDLSAIDADTGTAGNQAFHIGATAAHAGDITYAYDAASDRTVLRLFTDGDAKVDMTIRLEGHVIPVAADFVL